MVVSCRTMGPAVCIVRWNERLLLGCRRAAVALGQLKKSLNGRAIRTGREREGHGGAVEPETAQGLLCGGVHLVVRSWDACLVEDGDYF